MERRELLERLAPLVPPPRAHQVRYHGILAPCASGRSFVVPARPPQTAAASLERATEPQPGFASLPGTRHAELVRGGREIAGYPSSAEAKPTQSVLEPGAALAPSSKPIATHRAIPHVATTSAQACSRARRLSWSELLKRVFGVEGLRCPQCGNTMRVMTTITDLDVARRILASMSLPPRAPPLTTASSSSGLDRFETDEVAVVAPEASEPEFDFDQTRPDRSGNEGFD